MSRAFDLGNKIRKQKNGIANPPNEQLRIAPPEWKRFKIITATTSAETVPQNVYQVLVMVFGGGGNGSATAGQGYGGGGGGFAMGIIDVVPNRIISYDYGRRAGRNVKFWDAIDCNRRD
jgi:hypothetical protein